MTDDTDEIEMVGCSRCAGSGEGLHEGWSCGVCKGAGEVRAEPDDYDEDDVRGDLAYHEMKEEGRLMGDGR